MNSYQWLLNLGVDPKRDSDTDIRRIRSLNFITFILAIIPIPYLFLYGWLGVQELVIMEIVTATSLFPIFYLNYLRKHKPAKVYCYFLNITYIFLYSTSLGHEAGLLLFYLIAVFLPLFIFDIHKDKGTLLLGYSLTFFYCIVDFYFDFQLFGRYLVDLETRQILFLSYVPSSFLLAFYTSYQISLSNLRMVDRLQDQQNELIRSVESKEKLIQDIDFTNRELHALVDNTEDEVFAIDKEGRYIIWNHIHEKMTLLLYGQRPEKRKELLYFSPPTSKIQWINPPFHWPTVIEESLTGQNLNLSQAFVKQERNTYSEYSIHPIPSTDGQEAIGAVIRGHDVTDLVESRDMLKSISERLKLSVDIGGIGIWEYDYQIKQFYFSRIMHDMFDIRSHKRSEITRQWYRLVAKEDREKLVGSIRKLLNGESIATQLKLKVAGPQGSRRIIQTNFHLLRKNRLPYKLIGSCIDITENENRNLELKQALDLAEKASEAKSDFLSVMSHEIRTPLNAIVGISDLLSMESQMGHNIQLLDSLKFSSKNLLGVIDDILEFNRIEAGKVDLQLELTHLKHLLDDLYHMHRVKANQQKIDLNFHKAKIPDLILADSNKLSQCLNNLLSNALKFTHKGSVSLTVTTIKEDFHTIWLQFRIEDSGIGIPADQVAHIFDKFTQVESQTSRQFQGSGLGLTITRKLVELMGGSIQVQSIEGQGSTFTLDIPFRQTSLKTEYVSGTNLQVKFDAIHGKRILIAEDNQLNRTVLEHFCEKLAIHVEFATNGQEAIQYAKEKNYDLILMDIQMPMLDGIEATETIRKKDQFIPILALSANVNPFNIERARKVGINDYLTKPVEFERFVNKVYELLIQGNN
ncbi:response regulator [bacterium SCSIO 12741]|nr:response regulator [bacterium SCSIO 12741]